jgi:hypothetical protein
MTRSPESFDLIREYVEQFGRNFRITRLHSSELCDHIPQLIDRKLCKAGLRFLVIESKQPVSRKLK